MYEYNKRVTTKTERTEDAKSAFSGDGRRGRDLSVKRLADSFNGGLNSNYVGLEDGELFINRTDGNAFNVSLEDGMWVVADCSLETGGEHF